MKDSPLRKNLEKTEDESNGILIGHQCFCESEKALNHGINN